MPETTTEEKFKVSISCSEEEIFEAINSIYTSAKPNYPDKRAFDPILLTDILVKQVITYILTNDFILEAFLNKRNLFKTETQMSGGYKIRYLGHGETKHVFLLTTSQGFRLAFGIMSYDAQNLGLQVPNDPKIFKLKKILGGFTYIFSDARTYLLLPICINDDPQFCMFFQEYIPQNLLKQFLAPISKGLHLIKMRTHIKRFAEQIKAEKITISDEYKHKRHWTIFHKKPAVIDVVFNVQNQ